MSESIFKDFVKIERFLMISLISRIPWIPIEDYDSPEGARKNLKADIWAYATTLWQIFSRGSAVQLLDAKAFFLSGDRLSKPAECSSIPVIYDIMLRGWEKDPDRRFSPQSIFAKLLTARKLFFGVAC